MATVKDIENVAREDLDAFINENIREFNSVTEAAEILIRMENEGRLQAVLEELEEIADTDVVTAFMHVLNTRKVAPANELAHCLAEAVMFAYMQRHEDADLMEMMAVRAVQNSMLALVGKTQAERAEDDGAEAE